jgi:hypothetical protein
VRTIMPGGLPPCAARPRGCEAIVALNTSDERCELLVIRCPECVRSAECLRNSQLAHVVVKGHDEERPHLRIGGSSAHGQGDDGEPFAESERTGA